MNKKHTPGPWRVREGVNECFIDAPNTVCLAVVNSFTDTEEARRDADLIAAAPELVHACKLAYIELSKMGCECDCEAMPTHCALCACVAAIQAAGCADAVVEMPPLADDAVFNAEAKQ